MGKLHVIYGFAQNVPTYTGRFGISFELGDPPTFVSMGSIGSPPFKSGEYIAIAGQNSGLGGGTISALAYRDIGKKAAARISNPFYYLIGTVFGLLGLAIIAMLLFVPDSPPSDASAIWAVSTIFVVVGCYCIYQMRLMRNAQKLLNQWKPPL